MKTYVTRAEALDRYPLTEEELAGLIDQGTVEAVNLIDQGQETLAIYDDDLAAYVAERDISPTDFEHLRGNLLGIGEAAREYKLSQVTISQWAKQGKLQVKKQKGQKKFIDQADVAYLVHLARAKKMRQGKKVF